MTKIVLELLTCVIKFVNGDIKDTLDSNFNGSMATKSKITFICNPDVPKCNKIYMDAVLKT